MAGGIVLPSVVGRGRMPGADDRLRALLADRRARPFAWGVHDCCLFAADAIEALLCIDPAAPLRSTYATERQARRVLGSMGGLQGVATRVLGAPLRAPLLACTGDVGLVRDGARELLGVCTGEHWTVPAARGLGLLPMGNARFAWRVGCA